MRKNFDTFFLLQIAMLINQPCANSKEGHTQNEVSLRIENAKFPPNALLWMNKVAAGFIQAGRMHSISVSLPKNNKVLLLL